MVSFFGLKFGSDKKKSDKGKTPEKKNTSEKAPAQPSGPKKWDQNLMGEGQFFGVGNQTLVNGSIRSVDMSSRPHTPASSRISPYNHNTHALAASSMYDLSNVSHVRHSSGNSLKPAASDTNLRNKYNNHSPGSNLKVPGPGFGSRPGTPSSGRTKAWVNPLDVHFGRTTPSAVPSAPRSPLAHYEFAAEPEPTVADNSSVFGDKAENIADSIMRTVSQKEQEKADKERQEKGKVEKEREEREARQKTQEEEKKREEDRQKEQEKHRAAAAAAALRSPPQQGPPGHPALSHQRPMNGPVFQGRHDQRPSSRNGSRNPSPMGPVFQGQGEHRPSSRNGSRPSPPIGHGPNRGPFQGHVDQRPSSRNGQQQQHDQHPRFQGQMDQRPSSRSGPHERPHDRPHFQGQMDQRPGSRNGPQDRPIFQGQTDHHRPSSRNGPRRDHTPPYGHPPGGHPNGHPNGRPMNGGGPRSRDGSSPMRGPPGPVNSHPRSPGLGPGPMNGHINSPKGSPMNGPMGSPSGPPRGPAMSGSPRNGSPRNASPMNGGPGPNNRPSPNPNNSNNVQHLPGQNPYFPGDVGPSSPTTSTPTTTTMSTPRTSDEKPSEPIDRPVIRDVPARRDTITSTSPKRASVSMALSALEKSLLVDPTKAQASGNGNGNLDFNIRDSSASSAYSVDDNDPSQAESPIQPRPSPPYAAYPARSAEPQRSTSGSNRPIPGRNVARPNAEQYGIALPKGRTLPPLAAAAATDPPSPPLPSPPAQRMAHASLQPAPLFNQPRFPPPPPEPSSTSDNNPNRHSDFSAPRPAPTPRVPSAALSALGTTPPTPDPTNPNWPLAPPPAPSSSFSNHPSSTATTSSSSPPTLSRPSAPPPLTFNFSPEAFSRDHAGPYTSQLPPLSQSRSNDTLRPSTAGGAPATGLGVSSAGAGAGAGAGEEWDHIGMARGPSVRRPGQESGGGGAGGGGGGGAVPGTPSGISDRFGTPLI